MKCSSEVISELYAYWIPCLDALINWKEKARVCLDEKYIIGYGMHGKQSLCELSSNYINGEINLYAIELGFGCIALN